MEYLKQKEESEFDYVIRLVEGKSAGMYDLYYTELFKLAFGVELNPDECRKRYYGLKMLLPFIDKTKYKNITSEDLLSELDLKQIELQKAKQRFFDQRAAFNKVVVREEARKDELVEIIERTINAGNLPKINFTPQLIQHTDNDLLVSLNDLHFGANINNAWNIYNSDICKQRLDEYLDKILEIQAIHNSENCYVCANGDLINGNIHVSVLVSNKENIIEQIMGVSEYIAQFLSELSKHFNNVIFTEVAGNHSRLGTKEQSLKNERMDDLVPWYIKARLQNVDNVYINENIDNTMSIVDIRGKQYLQIHGDYDNGKSAIQSVALMSGKDIYAVCCGHKHHNQSDYVNNIKVIMSGSFLGMDDYCVTKRIVGIPQQMVCVCNDEGIKCSYDINF